MEDKSMESYSTSNSSLSSRKTSNFFPHSGRQNSSPILSSFVSAPITPIIPSSIPGNGGFGYQSNGSANGFGNLSGNGLANGIGNVFGNGNVFGVNPGPGSTGSGTLSMSAMNYSGNGPLLTPNLNVQGGGNTNYYNPGFGSNQSTPLFNDFEFNDFKSPSHVQRRASSFNSNFQHDIWGQHSNSSGQFNGSGSKTPYKSSDEFSNFPLESRFETALEFDKALNKSILELDSHLNSTIDSVFEELAPDQLAPGQYSLEESMPVPSTIESALPNQPNLDSSANKSTYGSTFKTPNYNYGTNYNYSYGSNQGQSSQSSFGHSSSGHASFTPNSYGQSSFGQTSVQSSNHSSYSQPSTSTHTPLPVNHSSFQISNYQPSNHQTYNYSQSRTSTSSVHTSTSSTGQLDISVIGSGMTTEEEEIIIKLPNCKPIDKPELNIQKYSESFSSTFYKRNKNGYMYIKESNDDLIKLEDDYFNIDLKFGKTKKSLMINVNDLLGTEFINDFKLVKRKPIKRYS